MTLNSQLKTTLAAAAGLAFAASSTSAAILLTESFSGSNGTNLVGTTTSDGNDWTGSTVIKADGSMSGSNSQSYYLSLGTTVVSGGVYTIDTSYHNNGNGNNNEPTRIGFSVGALDNNGNTNGGGQRSGGPAFDMFIKGDALARFYPDSTMNEDSSATISASWDLTAQVVLDTTDAAHWMLSYNDGQGNALHAAYDLGTGNAFDTLWIGHERSNGALQFDNIQVTGPAVPEPTTTALLGLGGLALILRRRK